VFSEIYWLPSAETLVPHFYIPIVVVNSMLAKIFLIAVINMTAWDEVKNIEPVE